MRILIVLSLLFLSIYAFDENDPESYNHENDLGAYVQEKALRAVYLTYASYCGNLVDSNWNCYWCKNAPGFKWVGNFGDKKSPHFGFVGYHPQNRTVWVIYRGTDNIAGWIADFNIVKVRYASVPHAQVHKGFYDAYLLDTQRVKQLLSSAQKECGACNEVVVAGHSLGGAIATISALDLVSQTNKTFSLYTFGSPRVGNSAFASYVKSKIPEIYRMTNDRDPVPHLPLKSMSYYHVPVEIWERKSDYRRCNNDGEDSSCSNSIKLTNPKDHGEYMNVKIWPGINYGCLYSILPEP